VNKKFVKFLDTLNIKIGDKLYISSDITQILIFHKKIKSEFKPNDLIDYFLNRLGKNGTLIFPTFNWDFCKGIPFDYFNTQSKTGSLAKVALSREDFIRTKHPIYSFAVKGADQNMLYELDDESGWGPKSVFAYFHENNVKNLFIGIDYKNGFTFDHYFEEKVGVDYRYFKYFSAEYFDRHGNKGFKKYKMYVRDLEKNVTTAINIKMDNVLIKKKAYEKMFFEEIYFGLIDMKISGDVMLDDIKKRGGLIYPKKI
jgi:aminoglycoside 3-N-acetyltransferase